MKVPLLDLPRQYLPLRDEHEAAFASVVNGATFILGPEVEAFEHELARFIGVEHAVGVASGTDALVLALRALGIGPGDEVIVPAYTFFATAEAVMHVGADPVFVDIEPSTYSLRIDHVADALSDRTRALIPVHLFGHPANMHGLRDVVPDGVWVIEDNAQAIGARHHGELTGNFGHACAYSFFPSKNLGAFGDAGMVTCSDESVADKLRMLRTHGWRKKYHPEMLAYNSRLDALQAAILRVNLRHLPAWNAERRAAARRYAGLLADLPIELPVEAPGNEHVYHLYVIRLPDRDRVAEQLRAAGIGCGVYYPVPLHRVPPCAPYARGQSFPESERASRETLAIPIFPGISAEQQSYVAETLRQAVAETTTAEAVG